MCNSSYLAAKPIRRHRPVGLRAESHTPPALAAGCQKSRLLPVEAELAQLSRRREAPLALPQTQAAQSGPAAARARAWVSRNQFGNAPCSWNIDSIGYCQKNSFNCTTCSCQRDVSQSEEKPPKAPRSFLGSGLLTSQQRLMRACPRIARRRITRLPARRRRWPSTRRRATPQNRRHTPPVSPTNFR